MAEVEEEKRGQRFYEILAEIEKEFPSGAEALKELKEIYNKTKDVISKVMAGISDACHRNYTPDLFREEDFDLVRKTEGERREERGEQTDTTLI